ncbi:hypothetical protein [Flagellimonas meishanensis]|uniref:hypothetical protein n=1 Tax=Flagellimonas meishanensis TaxID=2873264 RepID=UPI001CA6AFB7|nr:hypothetical protein [[Muricauda] meishanensis]
MSVSELQNDIIKKLLTIEDSRTLTLFKEMLQNCISKEGYQVSDLEKNLISESLEEYKKGHVLSSETIYKRNEEWLKE